MESNHLGYGLVVFIVYGPNPSEYVGTMMWQEKILTGLRNVLTPLFFPQGGDGSNELESVVLQSPVQLRQSQNAGYISASCYGYSVEVVSQED